MPDFHGYTPEYSGFEGNHFNGEPWREAYERVLPEHLTGPHRDTFTSKMIEKFSVEGQDKETGKPNGKFYVDHDKTKEAALEVIGTHLNLKGKDAEDYLKKHFEAVWEHFDVNHKGALEADELNYFMRMLCKPLKEHIILE
mmetsp:Transcript_3337/g.5559  ORF Transcript_3337/g.5559 Transcript_3337/m.5559 type:complete len:141 (-) Transcript_3337:133-555(-)